MRGGRGAIGAALLFAAALAIWALVFTGLADGADARLLTAIAGAAAGHPALDHAVLLVTRLGNWSVRLPLMIVAIALLLILRRDARAALWLAATVAVGAAVNEGLKRLVHRARPELLEHLDHVRSLSFPSAHAQNSMLLWLALACLLVRETRAPRGACYAVAVAIALAIGVTRLMLAVHWPSDVAAGWCIGAGLFLLASPLLAEPERPRTVARS